MKQAGFGKVATGLQGIKCIDEIELSGKRVFIRCDFNVPTKVLGSGDAGEVQITDDTRIRAALATIKYAMSKSAKLILASHFGRPENLDERHLYSLEPIAKRLGELLNVEVLLTSEPASDSVKALLPGLKANQIILLENLRFDSGETKNSQEFALRLAAFSDVYINDAFGASHRAHASIDALPRLVATNGCGFLIKNEIASLTRLTQNPDRPFCAVLGGAKVSDKINVIENLIDSVDAFIIGGAMAYTFLEAKGIPVGRSRVERDRLNFARELMGRLEARNKRLLLPIDHVVVDDFLTPRQISSLSEIPAAMLGMDIGPQSTAAFASEIARAKTVFWNGPMGVFERPEFASGSIGIARAMAELCKSGKGISIVGGGDSAAAAEVAGVTAQLTHVSTGGGASLEFLEGAKLPGIEALRSRRESVAPSF